MPIQKTLINLLKTHIRPILLPIIRSYIRYFPIKFLKLFIWEKIANPYFLFAKHRSISKTIFNQKITTDTTDEIQRSIYYFGIWEPNLTYFLTCQLKPGDIFVDVGANIGFFSLLASKIVGKTGKVISIEASPQIHSLLLRNISLNSLSNIYTQNIAITDKEGTVRIYHSEESNIGESSILKPADQHDNYDEVKACSLSDALTDDEIQKSRIIKIDVEGAEYLVTQGLSKIFSQCNKKLEFVIEINPKKLADQSLSTDEIFSLFMEEGFHPYLLSNSYDPKFYLNHKKSFEIKELTLPLNQSRPSDIIFSKTDYYKHPAHL